MAKMKALPIAKKLEQTPLEEQIRMFMNLQWQHISLHIEETSVRLHFIWSYFSRHQNELGSQDCQRLYSSQNQLNYISIFKHAYVSSIFKHLGLPLFLWLDFGFYKFGVLFIALSIFTVNPKSSLSLT